MRRESLVVQPFGFYGSIQIALFVSVVESVSWSWLAA
jgi:hypothetical protein